MLFFNGIGIEVQYMQSFKCFDTTECYIGLSRAEVTTFYVYNYFIKCQALNLVYGGS